MLYVWHVDFAKALKRVPHDWSVYHIYDEYSHSEVEQQIGSAEDGLIRAVDQVITVSPTMFERKGRLNSNTVLLTNGVDYDAFAQPTAEPEDLRNIPRPRIGYAGVVKRQLDWELISALVARRPDWSFVFAGARAPHPDITETLDRLTKLPNVMFLGMKAVDALAQYPQHFDVCVMPYRENDYTKYIYPLKLHEYLASGRPVVSIPLPALAGLERHVTVAQGPEDWERAIQVSLAPDANAGRAERQAEARRHDWATIADDIATLIRRGLNAGTAP
ncbi:MAG TPA: glycosyltransferase [Gemmatimonadaceae bacterium]|nr:glycosyltransferase [Gemmatimonadaceae bacterium]